MKYYLGAYYFLKLCNINYGSIKDTKVCTCSTCINDSFLDAWSVSWGSNENCDLPESIKELNLTNIQIKEIQAWADQKLEEKEIGWVNTFSDYSTLSEYKSKFFNYVQDYEILSIYFPEQEKNSFIEEFTVQEKGIGALGLWDNLNNQILEKIDESEKEIGYDLIGVELSGDFHTFHCHDLAEKLTRKFNIQINKYGLIASDNNWKELVEYMNDEENGFEPVPWYFVKVKVINEAKKSL